MCSAQWHNCQSVHPQTSKKVKLGVYVNDDDWRHNSLVILYVYELNEQLLVLPSSREKVN